jgi:uncharacterized protein
MRLGSLVIIVGLVALAPVGCLAMQGPEIVAAAENQDRYRVNRLIEQGADVDARQIDGMTALHWSVYHDDLEMTAAIVAAKADVALSNHYGVTPLALACINGNAEIVKLLLSNGADASAKLAGGETALMTASRTGNVDVVKALLSHGADVSAKERKGQTAVMWGAAEGHADVVELLVNAGAKVNETLPSGFNALFFAVRAGKSAAVDVLLRYGADVNQALKPERSAGRAPRIGTSPLIMAIENGHLELAIHLVDAGADPNDERSGYAPLHTLSWVRKPNRGDGEDGDPPPIGSGSMDSLRFVREMVKRGANVNQRLSRGSGGRGKLNRQGATPLMMSAITADLPLMKLLVDLGADTHISNSENCTPLMAAAGIGSLAPGEEAGTEPEVLECLEFLLQHGADINAIDDHGETAMHGAAYKSLPQVVAYLASKGARPEIWNRPNAYGWTPLSIASGTRVGNFKPSQETMAAIEHELARANVAPAQAKAASVDIYQKPAAPAAKANSSGDARSKDGRDAVSALAEELKKIVGAQAASWNTGDIDGYMQAYWKSPELTFSSGGDVERGWTATRDRYKRRYPDRQTMGMLKFTELTVLPLDDHAALMLGRWELERTQPIGGTFSLVWKQIDGRWLIVHDHTSVKK